MSNSSQAFITFITSNNTVTMSVGLLFVAIAVYNAGVVVVVWPGAYCIATHTQAHTEGGPSRVSESCDVKVSYFHIHTHNE